LNFDGFFPLDTIDDFTRPPDTGYDTGIQLIKFSNIGGYSLGAVPFAWFMTLEGDIVSDTNGGTSTISLPLNVRNGEHRVQVNGSDTIVLSGSANLIGNGIIDKEGPGTLVMSGDHLSFQPAAFFVDAGTLRVGSDNGLAIGALIRLPS